MASTGQVSWFIFQLTMLQSSMCLQATYSRESHLMHLIRVLVFLASHFKFWFTASHVPGVRNALADALSRNNAGLFLSQVHHTQLESSSIPGLLIELLVCNITWTSTVWTNCKLPMSLRISILTHCRDSVRS